MGLLLGGAYFWEKAYFPDNTVSVFIRRLREGKRKPSIDIIVFISKGMFIFKNCNNMAYF